MVSRRRRLVAIADALSCMADIYASFSVLLAWPPLRKAYLVQQS
jgi:hypothetical protein